MHAPMPSLHQRLLMTVLGIVVVVWTGAAVSTWLDVRKELDELLDGHLAQAAAILVVQQADELEEGEHSFDTPALHPYAPKVVFQVFSGDRLLMHSANAPSHPIGAAGSAFKPGFSTITVDGVDWRVFSTVGTTPDTVIYVGEEVTSRSSILWAVIRGSMLPMALALPILAVLLWLAVRRGLDPLRELGVVLKDRHPHALEAVHIQSPPAEIAPVLEALNSLFDRIQTLLESERRFTADASHELRTPIAAIRAQAQSAHVAADSALRHEALAKTLEGCDRAAHVVDQLLVLSRLDASGRPMLEATPVHTVTRNVVADLAPHAVSKDQSIELLAESASFVLANPTLLAILVRNLVDNAIRYSPSGARIQVAVIEEGGGITVTVQDSGPGLEEPDMHRLGERFFRVGGQSESGSGLGWSIVRRIAAVHSYRIEARRSAALGGLAVAVTIPSPVV